MSRKRIALSFAASAAVLLMLFSVLLYRGILTFNRSAAAGYPVRGVDVSHYQGKVDFTALASQDLSFAFIKATEGSSHVDSRFEENLAAVRMSPLRFGFYHFFSYDSSGAAQAEHFINTVPKLSGMLPPVIDVEFYGDYFLSPASAGSVVPQLRDMVEALRAHYGVCPIIYCTGRAHQLYIDGSFDDCDLWIREIRFVPDDGWTFWQYTDSAMLEGYSGAEQHIDVNVFHGTADVFALYPETSAH